MTPFRLTETTSGRARSAAAAEAGTLAEKPLMIPSLSVIRPWRRRGACSTERSLPGAARTITESQVEPEGRTVSQVEPRGRTVSQVEPRGLSVSQDEPAGWTESQVEPAGRAWGEAQLDPAATSDSTSAARKAARPPYRCCRVIDLIRIVCPPDPTCE